MEAPDPLLPSPPSDPGSSGPRPPSLASGSAALRAVPWTCLPADIGRPGLAHRGPGHLRSFPSCQHCCPFCLPLGIQSADSRSFYLSAVPIWKPFEDSMFKQSHVASPCRPCPSRSALEVTAHPGYQDGRGASQPEAPPSPRHLVRLRGCSCTSSEGHFPLNGVITGQAPPQRSGHRAGGPAEAWSPGGARGPSATRRGKASWLQRGDRMLPTALR